MPRNRLAIALSGLAVVSCLIVGALLHQTPRSPGWKPSLVQAAAMIAVPTIAAVVGTWAAWHDRPIVLLIATLVVGLFSAVTGFSIGRAFWPAVALLAWGTLASFGGDLAHRQSA